MPACDWAHIPGDCFLFYPKSGDYCPKVRKLVPESSTLRAHSEALESFRKITYAGSSTPISFRSQRRGPGHLYFYVKLLSLGDTIFCSRSWHVCLQREC